MNQKVKSSSNLVTKEFFKRELKRELKRFATKDDLKRFATKDDLKRFPTKDDLKRFATKDDLFDFKIEVIAELSKAELKALDREQVYHSNVMTKFDKIMKKLETNQQENEIGDFRRDGKIEDHEKRIKVLESAQKS